ncbi:hypothetical protein F5B21DRAFT_497250 [Xylaria acuta]|nr:hypothetical protein F5B21DRAFT_497250 [Xylaria acuta]
MQKIEKAQHELKQKAERRYLNAKLKKEYPKENTARSSRPFSRQENHSNRRRIRRSSSSYRGLKNRFRRRSKDYYRNDQYRYVNSDRDKRRKSDRNQESSRDREGSRDRNRNRDRTRDRARNGERDRSRNRKRNRSRDRERDRSHNKHRNNRYNDRHQSVHFVNSEQSNKGRDSQYKSDRGYYSGNASYYVLSSELTCRKCHKTYESASTLSLHMRKCTPHIKLERIVRTNTPSPLAPERRTCEYCSQVLPSRNELFKHLKSYKAAKASKVKKPRTPTPNKTTPREDKAEVPNKEVPITKAPSANKYNKALHSSYTYLRFKARAIPTELNVEVCADLSTGNTIVSYKHLKTIEHTVESKNGQVLTVGNTRVKITK